MAASKGIILCQNVSTVANQPAQYWPGGFASLMISATTFPSSCFLQVQSIDGTWINLAPATVTSTPATISANSAYGYNIPAGQVRIGMSGGSVAALSAALAAVTFD